MNGRTQTVKLTEDTWSFEDGFVRYFLLVGQEKALLIDTGVSGGDVLTQVRALSSLPVVLVNTHGDGDHTAGNACFPEVRIMAADYENCRMKEKYPSCALKELTDGEIIDLGGREIEVIAVPGHTAGSAALLDRRDGVLYSGDTVQDSHIYMFGSHREPARFAASLRKLEERSGSFVLIRPSHGTPALPPAQIGRVLDAWNGVQSGRLTGVPQELHGNEIMKYDADACGFYCGRTKE